MTANNTAAPIRPQRPKRHRILAGILLGLGISVFFGVRAIRAFHEFRYMQAQGLDRGTASVDAIRPWMTIRFVAVAYAVPEEFVYNQLAIPVTRRNADQSLAELNDIYQLGPSPHGSYPLILDTLKAAILAYRANPVAPGLPDLRPWMSVRYIANGTGVPMAAIFNHIGISMAGNEDKPLDMLSAEQHYPGGMHALIAAIDGAIATEQGK